MRKILLAATALTSSVLFLVPGAQAFDWNGAYAGGVVGIVKSTGDVEFTYEDIFIPSEEQERVAFDGVDVIGGVTVGYNFVLSNDFVVGIEADASHMGLSSSESEEGASASERLNSLLTLRTRIGVVKGETLFYATAGLAGAQVRSTSSYETPFGEFLEGPAVSNWATGFVGGVGVEHAVSENLTIKGEVLAFTLRSQSSGASDFGKGFESRYNPSGAIFRTGINFHF